MKKHLLSRALPLLPVLFILAVGTASAANTGAYTFGANNVQLPWESALGGLAQALTGTTAKVIAVIAIFIAGIALVLGEDLGQFARRLLMIVIAVAFLVGAGSFIAPFTAGAVIF